MKIKILNLILILSSLIGYLEWGGGNQSFLFQAEWEILSKFVQEPLKAIHPFTLLPLIGQVLLSITLFQKEPNKILTVTGLLGIGILIFFMFIIGLTGLNFNVLVSTMPFLITSFLVFRYYRLKKLKEINSK